jgi:hypothetical protein
MVAGGVHQIVRATVAECVRRSPMPAYLVVANYTLGGISCAKSSAGAWKGTTGSWVSG